MPTPYPNSVVNPQPGESVTDPAVVGRPLNQLTQRTTSINQRVESQLIGSTLFDWEAPVQGDTVPGMAVYLDNNGVWRPAVAEITIVSGEVQIDLTALAAGIVQYKHTNTTANIALFGKLRISEADLQSVTISGAAETGVLFSSSDPLDSGKLTKTRPPVAVPITFVSGPDGDNNYTMLVAPGWHDFLYDHVHFHHRLDNNQNTAWETAAAYESRTGLTAPAGSQFRYDHENDADLNSIWPPVPIGAVHYDLDGIAADLENETQIRIDTEGVWWMDSGSNPDSVRHDLYFTTMTFATDDAVVTGVQALDDSVQVFNLKTGLQTSTGVTQSGPVGLKARFESDRVEDQAGSQALVNVDSSTNAFNYGPIVTGLKSGSPSLLTISGGLVHPNDSDAKYGNVLTLTAADPDANRSGNIDFTVLNNVPVLTVEGLYGYALQDSPLGSIGGRINVPDVGLGGTFDLTLTFTVAPLVDGTMPDLPISYKVLPQTGTPTAMSSLGSSSITLALSSLGALNAKEFVTIEAPAINGLSEGDTVSFSLSRNAVGGFNGDIFVLSQSWTTTASGT